MSLTIRAMDGKTILGNTNINHKPIFESEPSQKLYNDLQTIKAGMESSLMNGGNKKKSQLQEFEDIFYGESKNYEKLNNPRSSKGVLGNLEDIFYGK